MLYQLLDQQNINHPKTFIKKTYNYLQQQYFSEEIKDQDFPQITFTFLQLIFNYLKLANQNEIFNKSFTKQQENEDIFQQKDLQSQENQQKKLVQQFQEKIIEYLQFRIDPETQEPTSFLTIIKEKSQFLLIHNVFEQILKYQVQQNQQSAFVNTEFYKCMSFFFAQTCKLWAMPLSQTNSLESCIFYQQTKNIVDYVTLQTIFQQFLPQHDYNLTVLNKILKLENYYENKPASIYEYKKINFYLKKNIILHRKLLPKQARFLIKLDLTEQMTLQAANSLIEQFMVFRNQIREIYNQDKNNAYLQGFYELLYLIDDIIYRSAVKNYEELKKETNQSDIFEVFKKEDIPSQKEDWRTLKDTIELNENLEQTQLNYIIQMFNSLCYLNMCSNKLNWIMIKVFNFYFKKIDPKIRCKLIYNFGEYDLQSDDIEYKVEQWAEKQYKKMTIQQSFEILWFLCVKYNQNTVLLQKLIDNINQDQNNYSQFLENDLHRIWIIKHMFNLEFKNQIKWNISSEQQQIMKQQFNKNYQFFNRKSGFSDFIQAFFDRFGYNSYKNNVQVGIFNFLYVFEGSNVCLILDRECYRGRTKEEIGVISLMRRYLVKNKKRMRIFEYYEWKKLTRRNLKHNYLKLKMNKISQDEEFINKKYYYNF